VIFFATIIIIEVFYRIYLRRRAKPHIIPDATMTPDEFNKKVSEGK